MPSVSPGSCTSERTLPSAVATARPPWSVLPESDLVRAFEQLVSVSERTQTIQSPAWTVLPLNVSS